MTDLNELQFFVHVARTQSFTLAAQHLSVPKSSVSRAMRRLEARLGVRLVERTTRSVTLTEAGELYLNHCQRIVEEAEQADLAMGTLLAKPRGRLRIGAPAAFARSILGTVLAEFLALYPELRVYVQLLNGNTSPREGSFDIVVRSGPLEDSGLLVKPLMRIWLGAYASPSYLESRGVPDSPASLRQHSCITTSCGPSGEPGDTTVWRLRRGAEYKEVRIEARASMPDPTINHQLALDGAGITLLSQSAVCADVEQGRLVRLLPDWELEPVEIYALYPSQLNSSPKVRALLQFLRDRFKQDSISSRNHNRIKNQKEKMPKERTA